jgi:lipid-A-disaccharide synthase
METPFVMVYRVTPLTYLLGRSTVKVPHFAMVNLIAGERVVPELVQQEFTAERVAAEMNRIIPDGSDREKMLKGLPQVRRLLRCGGTNMPPADKAAGVVIEMGQRGTEPAGGSHPLKTAKGGASELVDSA